MSTWEMIVEEVRTLPPERQKEVLDFVEFIKGRDSSGRPRRSPAGLWADLGVNVSAEDIAEARREMWGSFPREDI
ncbi:MAG: DUF2281 domain-containing protein [candidate division Zixibacteria bacterium]|nr:DUF2281 domain-containing protein [candidate division Zixibacteria bacterium]